MFATHFGSIDNTFIDPKNNELVKIPDGVAHFLEHKMFEQENGKNSLDVLTSLGVNANAYTTNNYTTYLFEATDNFYPALDELMDYVQNPYFTDENVEKEKGIIIQEIKILQILFHFLMCHDFTRSGFSAINLLQSGRRCALAFSVVCLV